MSRLINYGIYASSRQRAEGDGDLAALPTARWYIASAELNSSNSAATTLSEPRGSTLKPDGTEFYIAGLNNSTASIAQITFETGYDFTTQTGEKFLDVSARDTEVSDVVLKSDGTKLYFVGVSGTNIIYQYSLSTPWDISTASYDFSSTANFTGNKIFWNSSGNFLYGVDQTTVYWHSLSTPWNIGTISQAGTLSLGPCTGADTIIQSVNLKPDGTELYIASIADTGIEGVEAANYVYHFSLRTAWFVGSAIFTGRYQDSTSDSIQDIWINPNTGTEMVKTANGSITTLDITLPNGYDDPVIFRSISATGTNSEGTDIFASPLAVQGFEESNWNSYFPSYRGKGQNFDYDSATATELVGTTLPVPESGTLLLAKDGCSTQIKRGPIGPVNSETVFIENTPTDINNASYDSVDFFVGSQDSIPQGLEFDPTGTKMYIVGRNTDSIYQYSLATPFDISTLSYDGVSLAVGSQDFDPSGVTFDNTGTKMYMVGDRTPAVFQYTLGSAYDLSTASYDGVQYNTEVAGDFEAMRDPQDVLFNNDGTRMYTLGSYYEYVEEHLLSTPYDISTATWSGVRLDTQGPERQGYGMAFNNTGERLFIVGTGARAVTQWSFTTAYDLSTASYDGIQFSVSSQDSGVHSVKFSSDGTKMYIVGVNSDRVHQYSVNGTVNGDEFRTQWTANISSLGLDSAPTQLCLVSLPRMFTSISPNESRLLAANLDIDFVSSTTTSYIGGINGRAVDLIAGDTVIPYDQGEPGDEIDVTASSIVPAESIQAITYTDVELNVSGQEPSASGITFNNDGSVFYITGYTFDRLVEYSMTTNYDLSTANNTGVTFSFFSQDSTPMDVAFNNDGTRLFMLGYSGNKVFQYDLSAPYDVSTIVYNDVFSDLFVSNLWGFEFSSDGTRMLVVPSSNEVYQFTLATPFDISDITLEFTFNSSQDFNIFDIAYSNSGARFYTVGHSGDVIYEYILSTPFDTSTATYDNVNFKLRNNGIYDPRSIAFSEDETVMFVLDDRDNVHEFIVTKPTTYNVTFSALPYAPSLLTIPARVVEHTAINKQEWVGDYISTTYRKVVSPDNRSIQGSLTLPSGATAVEMKYDLTKAGDGTRDTEGLTPP